MYNKLGIGPVVGSALLLVVAVVAVIGFQNWYTTFQSTTLVDIDQESSSSNSLQIQGLNYGNLYFKSSESNISSLRIISEKTGTEMCIFSGSGEVNNSGLVGLWKLDDESSVIEDKSGNENHGTLYGNTRLLLDFDDGSANDKTGYNNDFTTINGATYITNDCISGGCYQFDGNDNMQLNYNQNMNFSNEISVSLWVKLIDNVTSTSDGIFTQDEGSGQDNSIVIAQDTNRIEFDIRSNDGLYRGADSNNLILNQFHHIVSVFDGINLELYIDGVLHDNNSFSSQTRIYDFSNSFRLGVESGRYFNGTIDEVAIYSKTLSENEVIDLYNSQKAKFIEFVNSPIDKAVEFDGIDDYIEIPHSNSLNLVENYTIFTYFSIANFNPENYILAKQNDTNNYINYALALKDFSSRVSFFFRESSWDEVQDYNPKISLKKYYNLVGRNLINNFSIYENGLLKNISNYSNSPPIDNSPLFFGDSNYYSGSLHNFNGQIDEVRIYNRTLTEDEIKDLYFYSIKQTNDGTNSIDLSSCNLENNQPYQIQLFTNEGSIIESRFNN